MISTNKNHIKKMIGLRYKEEILQLHKDGVSIRKITEIIAKRSILTNLKSTIGKSTIAAIIKKYKEPNDS